MINKLLKYTIRGALWGNLSFVLNLILHVYQSGAIGGIFAERFIFSAVLYMATGAAMGMSGILYQTDLRTLCATIIHFVICSAVFLTFMLLLGLFRLDSPNDIIISIASFVIIYSVIWIGSYLYDKNEEQKINETLKKREAEVE